MSYIDLYQGRASRQHELRTTKHFDCACARCEEEGVVVGAGVGSDIRTPIVPGALLDVRCAAACAADQMPSSSRPHSLVRRP